MPEGQHGRRGGSARSPVVGVDRVGVHARVVGEQCPGTVAVVHVEVNHEHATGEALSAQVCDGHGDIVEDAVAQAARALGVVEAAAQVDGDAARAQRLFGRQQRAPGHHALKVEEALGAPWVEAHPARPQQRGRCLQALDVLGRVHAQQRFHRRGLWAHQARQG